MDYTSFREKQNGIYTHFRNTQDRLGSTAVLDGVIKPQGAFLVAFRHPDEITHSTEAFSRKIHDALTGSAITSLVYDRNTLHTTLSDHRIGSSLVNPSDPEDKRILDALSLTIRRGLGAVGINTLMKRRINFDHPLVNANSAIIAGDANDAVLDVIGAIRDTSKGVLGGEGLKGSWGAHMTAARFHGRSTLAQADKIRTLATETDVIGTSVPMSIDVGYLKVDENGFDYTTHERFKL